MVAAQTVEDIPNAMPVPLQQCPIEYTSFDNNFHMHVREDTVTPGWMRNISSFRDNICTFKFYLQFHLFECPKGIEKPPLCGTIQEKDEIIFA